MINLSVEAKPDDAIGTINARVEESATVEDMREAWGYLLQGTLKAQLHAAIFQACFNRGIDPKTILTEDPQN
jgi:hypothetical protein